MKKARWVGIVLFLLFGQLLVFGGTAAAQSDACRVGQELGPGDYCTVDLPGIDFGGNRFSVRSDGSGCYGTTCFGRATISLNEFRASPIAGTLRWRIDAVPGGGTTNRAPRPSGSVPPQTLAVGGSTASVNLAPYFTDPDGDTLTYAAIRQHGDAHPRGGGHGDGHRHRPRPGRRERDAVHRGDGGR